MLNCGLIKFKNMSGKYGDLVPIESRRDIPFEIKRIYYISEVENNVSRGFHSHKMLHQVLICVNGAVKIKVKNPQSEEIYELNDKSIGLYIGPLIWREMFDFQENTVLLVLASDFYDESDYIRNYDFYLEEAKKLFN